MVLNFGQIMVIENFEKWIIVTFFMSYFWGLYVTIKKRLASKMFFKNAPLLNLKIMYFLLDL